MYLLNSYGSPRGSMYSSSAGYGDGHGFINGDGMGGGAISDDMTAAGEGGGHGFINGDGAGGGGGNDRYRPEDAMIQLIFRLEVRLCTY